MKLLDPKMSLDTIKSYIEVWDCKGCLPYGGTQHNVMAVDDLPYLPTIEAEPVRHGRWIVHTTWNGMFGIIHSECSECKFDRNGDLSTWKFCQNCGRDMRATDTNVGGKEGVENDSK